MTRRDILQDVVAGAFERARRVLCTVRGMSVQPYYLCSDRARATRVPKQRFRRRRASRPRPLTMTGWMAEAMWTIPPAEARPAKAERERAALMKTMVSLRRGGG